MRRTDDINDSTRREILRRMALINLAWAVAIIALWCCGYIALRDLDTRYRLEDRV